MTSDAVQKLADTVGIKGTGRGLPFTPVFPFLLRLLPCTARSLLRVRFTGLSRISKSGPLIFAGNHTSHVDPLMKILGSRLTLRFLTKKEHFKSLGLRQVMTWTGQIETDRDAGAGDALSRAVDILRCGSPMGLFPEGTRSRNQEPPFLQRGKTGIARLAATFPDLTVHPIAIQGSRDMLAPRSSKFRLLAKVTLHVGEAVTWRQWLLHPDGGAYNSEKIAALIALDEQPRRAELGVLYRSFTDQFIESIRALGAP